MSRPPKVNHRGDVWCGACNDGRGAYHDPTEFRRGGRRRRYRSYCRSCERQHQRVASRLRYRNDASYRARVLELERRRRQRRRLRDAREAFRNLRILRARGLTNVAIADLVDANPHTVGHWLQGKQAPKQPFRKRIFEALRVTSPAA